jgi:glutathione S-transferase
MSGVTLPPGFGYVFGVLGSSFFMNMYLSVLVMNARKKYNVQYPALYAPTGHKFESEFNCVQRAHQNTLESYALVMCTMCTCGLVYPVTSAILGGIWVAMRFVYGYGYATYGPNGRMAGGLLSHIGDWGLTIMCLKIAYDMVIKQ